MWSWTRPGGKWHSPGRRVFVLGGSEFRPEGETTSQPRATPWEPRFRGSVPCKGATSLAIATSQSPVKNRILFRPVRARAWPLEVVPGQCPLDYPHLFPRASAPRRHCSKVSRPLHTVCQPGSPSLLRQRKPPRLAKPRKKSRTVTIGLGLFNRRGRAANHSSARPSPPVARVRDAPPF